MVETHELSEEEQLTLMREINAARWPRTTFPGPHPSPAAARPALSHWGAGT